MDDSRSLKKVYWTPSCSIITLYSSMGELFASIDLFPFLALSLEVLLHIADVYNLLYEGVQSLEYLEILETCLYTRKLGTPKHE